MIQSRIASRRIRRESRLEAPFETELMRGLAVNGRELHRRRCERGLTQDALAHLASCNVKTVRNAERGRRVDAATVKRIADAVGLPLAAIVLDQGESAPGDNGELFHRCRSMPGDE